jgi:dihydroorotate dehydrogenase electron transfer subunit
VDHLCLVAGGIGQTPFLTLLRRVLGQSGFAGEPARREVKRVSFFYGARSGDYFACLDAFQQTGATIHLATEDGSAGFAGYVTNLLDQKRVDGEQERTRWVGCGPEPMLHALASLAHARGIGCDVSLETPMACGVGICFSCVTKVKTTDGFDYRRTCVEGPIFDAAKLVW